MPSDAPRPAGLVDLVTEQARSALDRLERGVDRGFEGANAALATPDEAALGPLLAAGADDLPELAVEGPLASLSVRLDREADLLRSVALRELARVAWMERLALIVVVVAFVGEIVVAGAATLSAVAGLGSEGRTGLLALAAIVLAGAAGGAAAVVAKSRTAHRGLALEALARARAVEERIGRVAIALEWRASGPALFQDALARLEREGAPTSRTETGERP